MPLVKIKDFNALVDNKLFFGQPVKNKQEVCEKLFDTSRNNNYATWNLLDFSYQQNYCKLIGIYLSRQKNMNTSQQISFTGELEDDSATMFYIAKTQQVAILNFL